MTFETVVTMDTAKAANLYATYPADLLTYVSPPIGEGRPVPGTLGPWVAIPTTAGTGSETTGVAIFDLMEMHAKTGIAHRALRPVMGIVDPDNTRTLPKMGVRIEDVNPDDAGDLLAAAVVDLMRQAGIPNGLSAVGYGPEDVPERVAGTMPQHRVTKLCPRPFDETDLEQLFLDSLTCW